MTRKRTTTAGSNGRAVARSSTPRSRASKPKTPILPRVTVRFYGHGKVLRSRHLWRIWLWINLPLMLLQWYAGEAGGRRRALERYSRLTANALGGYWHVDMTFRGKRYYWSPARGMLRTALPPECPLHAETVIRCNLNLPQTVHPPMPARAVFYTVGLWPRLPGVETCSTMIAALLGIRRTCRTPRHVFEAIQEHDYGHH